MRKVALNCFACIYKEDANNRSCTHHVLVEAKALQVKGLTRKNDLLLQAFEQLSKYCAKAMHYR
jgi:hypothetical protein